MAQSQIAASNNYERFILGVKGGRCVGLTNLPPSCAECLEILGASANRLDLDRDGFTFKADSHIACRAHAMPCR
jgi:hypothetical protein